MKKNIKTTIVALCCGAIIGFIPFIFKIREYGLIYLFGIILLSIISCGLLLFNAYNTKSTIFKTSLVLVFFSLGTWAPVLFNKSADEIENEKHLILANDFLVKLRNHKDSTGLYPKSKYEVADSSDVDFLFYEVDSSRQHFSLDFFKANNIDMMIYENGTWIEFID